VPKIFGYTFIHLVLHIIYVTVLGSYNNCWLVQIQWSKNRRYILNVNLSVDGTSNTQFSLH
jgi:hypothetical protein